jgi:Holliday junction resolvase RusA-like endonuclease
VVSLRIDVLGVPRPQPRPRFTGGHAVSTTGPAKRWKQAVVDATDTSAARVGWACIAAGPVKLRIVIRFPTKDAARWWTPRTATRNADVDNVMKLLLDVLVDRGVIGDDGQVASVEQLHVWVPGKHAGAVIDVEPMPRGVWEWARAAWGDAAVAELGQEPDWLA